MKVGVKDFILKIWYLISMRKKYQVQNHILKCKYISQLGPKKHSLMSGQTLEILLIQEEPGLIFKEQVFISLVMIHCCMRPIIYLLVHILSPTTILKNIRDGKLLWTKSLIIFEKCNLGASFPSTREEISSMQVGVSKKCCWIWHKLKIPGMYGFKMVLPGQRSGLSWDLCTGGKDGLYQASFGNCHIEALGRVSHGCQELFL